MKTTSFLTPRHISPKAENVIDVFRKNELAISSENHEHNAFEVLSLITPGLVQHGFISAATPGVKSKKSIELTADDSNGSLICRFDAFNESEKSALVVHAGRGITNNDFLKSVLHASLSPQVGHLFVAVRNTYRNSNDFAKAESFLAVLFDSKKTHFDLESVTLIGY